MSLRNYAGMRIAKTSRFRYRSIGVDWALGTRSALNHGNPQIMSDPQNATFTEADLDRLEEWLDSAIFKDEAMQLDELQALICAVVSGPEVIPTSVWLTAALGGGGCLFR